MSRLVGIYGKGGCGRGIMPLAREMPELAGARFVFVDDSGSDSQVNGHAVLTLADFVNEPEMDKQAALAVADSHVRERMAGKCAAAGVDLLSVWAQDAMVMDDVEVGEGALVSPLVIFTSNIRVGRCFHANIQSYVEHDCVIGDFVTFAPGVRCNGNVTIGDRAYIGSGATIRQGVTIGADAVVGMGAVVVKNVPPRATVVGNPARQIVRSRD